jgi:hypothetical protein
LGCNKLKTIPEELLNLTNLRMLAIFSNAGMKHSSKFHKIQKLKVVIKYRN